MAYTFGSRIDNDSYALTTIDEDQGTSTTKGEINGVPFESGGGSSDFSTAEVTITYTGSDTIGFLGWWPFIADDRLGVGIGGGNEDSFTFDLLLYKNQPAVINFTDDGGCRYFYPYDAITVSGNATVDEYGDVTITGECTISLDGSKVEPLQATAP